MFNWLFFILLLLLSSCNYYSSVMFRTAKDYPYAKDTTMLHSVYRIANNDKVNIKVYTNNGSRMMDVFAGVANESVSQTINPTAGSLSDDLKVDEEGNVRLPMIGKVGLSGLTIAEAEKIGEDKYAKIYVNPFVIINVTNRRIMVFNGSGGSGEVVNLANENTTVVEALAMARGISNTGKAKSVRLIRKSGDQYKIYDLDLSMAEGLSSAHMPVMANDIIYVDQVRGFHRNITTELTTLVSLLTSILFIYEILRN